ncbi:hypothetical protein QBC45DRAFT_427439 [Copromyces sp. CBS 386.78]|nr:hypothetical protein QBC45DRAFT_427439 [Copromyces sp. CBS 386.78]
MIQSWLGNVTKESIFAYLQSAGAGGYGASFLDSIFQFIAASLMGWGVKDLFERLRRDEDPCGLITT